MAAYREKFGGLGEDFYRFVVLRTGDRPPPEVLDRMTYWRYPIQVGTVQMMARLDPTVPRGKAFIVVEPSPFEESR
jgi:hypothetical protein